MSTPNFCGPDWISRMTYEVEGRGQHRESFVACHTSRDTTIYVPYEGRIAATLAVAQNRGITLEEMKEVLRVTE